MSLILRPAESRFHGQHGWLDSRHSFSFADFYDPNHMGFRALRVINDDWIAPGAGFPTHPHRDMEILTYVTEGAVAHEDSTGGRGVTARGDVQAMSAGTGVRHSEFNASASEPLRLLQIWIQPERRGLPPRYVQARFEDAEKRDRLRLIASRDGRQGSVVLVQDVSLFASLLSPGASLSHALAPGRGAWVQVVQGRLSVNGTPLASGDGAALEEVDGITLTGEGESGAEVLLFDLG